MRRLVLFVLLCAPAAWPQYPYIPIVQSQSTNNNSSTSINCAFAENVTANNIVLVTFGWQGGTTPVVSDTLSSTWTQQILNTSNTGRVAVYTTTLGSSGADTITGSIAGSSFLTTTCLELPPFWSPTIATSSVTTYAGTPTTLTTPSITTTLNSDFIFAYIYNLGFGVFQLLQNPPDNTWYTVGSANAMTAFSRIGALAGSGNNVTVDSLYPGSNAGGTMFSLALPSNPLTVTSPALAPDGALTNAYSFTLLSAGGSGAITWSQTAGTLPTGLSLNTSTGAITGTPTISNNYSATFQATDGTHTATKALTFRISAAMSTPALVQAMSVFSGSAGSNFFAFTNPVTKGHAILVTAGGNTGFSNVSYCSDTLGTPFQTITLWAPHTVNTFNTYGFIQFVAGVAPATGADTVSCGLSSTNLVAMGEFSGVNFFANDNTLATRGSNASPATITSNNLTTLVPGELLLGACTGQNRNGVNSLNSPFLLMGNNSLYTTTGYDPVTTVTTYSMSCAQTLNTNLDWMIGLAGFRPAGNGIIGTTAKRIKRMVY